MSLTLDTLAVDNIGETSADGNGDITALGKTMLSDGFEDGNLTTNPVWSTNAVTATVSTESPYNGTYSLDIADGIIEHDRGASDGISDGDVYGCFIRPYPTMYTAYVLSNTSMAGVSGGADTILVNFSNGDIITETYDSSGNLIQSYNVGSFNNVYMRVEITFDVTNSQVDIRISESGFQIAGSILSYSGVSNIQYVDLENGFVGPRPNENSHFDDVTYTSTNSDATERGFVYSTTSQANPGNVSPASSSYEDVVNETGTFGTGAYSLTMSGLSDGTTYYVRSYGEDANGYVYGDEVSFSTESGFVPNARRQHLMSM